MKIIGMILSGGESKRMGLPKALLKSHNKKTLLQAQHELLKSCSIDEIYCVTGAHTKEIVDAHEKLEIHWVENFNWKLGQFTSIQSALSQIVRSENDDQINHTTQFLNKIKVPPSCQGGVGGGLFVDANNFKTTPNKPPLQPEADPPQAETPPWQGEDSLSFTTNIICSRNASYAILIMPIDVVGVRTDTITKLISACDGQFDAIVPKFGESCGHPVLISKNFAEGILMLNPNETSSRLDAQLKSSKVLKVEVDDESVTRNINTMDEWKNISLL